MSFFWDVFKTLLFIELVNLILQRRCSAVKDIKWHCKNENLFGSVGYYGELVIWDLRTNQRQQAVEEDFTEVIIQY